MSSPIAVKSPVNDSQPLQSLPDCLLEVSVDYFNGVGLVPKENFNNFIDFLDKATQLTWSLTPGNSIYKGRFFEHSGRASLDGGLIGWSELEREGKIFYDVWVSCSGALLTRRIGFVDAFLFILCLQSRWGFTPTRLDLKLRDYSKTITPERLLEAQNRCDLTGVGSRGARRLISSSSRKYEQDFSSLYIGWGDSNQSPDVYINCYYAMPKHGVDAVDYEVRISNSKGKFSNWKNSLDHSDLPNLCRNLGMWLDDHLDDYYLDKSVNLPNHLVEELARLVSRVILGVTDWIDRSSGERASRCPRLDWWQQICDWVDLGKGRLKIAVPQEPMTLKRKCDWVVKQVAPTLAAIADYLGDAWLRFEVHKARSRVPSSVKQLLKDHKSGRYLPDSVLEFTGASP